MTLIQQIAAAIAKANTPMQVDYEAMAEAAIRALVEAVSASLVDDDKDLSTAADDTREQARLQPLGTDWMDKPK